ncbi:hypothetical protein LTR08_007733 [Meristemomyces frigidus]|nr:hypothetical protein LTR08_007733 [Meristemomyces frigidus]
MDGGNAPSPDLQALLATLSQYTNAVPNGAPLAEQHSMPLVSAPFAFDIERSAASTPQPASAHASANAQRPQDPRLRPQSRSVTASPKPPQIDPATITVWQEGLRCVTKIAAQNSQFAVGIKKMMDDQRKHEMRWYSERQALKQMQNNRKSSSAQAAAILQSLGNGAAFPTTPAEAETENEAELAGYDCKIHAAQRSMEDAMTAEMKGLGVPFFGTDVKLVVPDDYDMTKELLPESHAKWSPLVTESELLTLRRRMVGHLEDLYRD